MLAFNSNLKIKIKKHRLSTPPIVLYVTLFQDGPFSGFIADSMCK